MLVVAVTLMATPRPYFFDQGNSPLRRGETAERQSYATYLASAFRSLRFGLHEAHGKGMVLQFNYLSDRGAFLRRTHGTFTVDMTKIKSAVRDRTHDLLALEATGTYTQAKKMLEELA